MQTAVLDNVDSEDPVELPMDVPGLELFRSLHRGHTFWCGLWLGGCGGRLTTRLCTDKICHFAHVPNPDAPDSLCRRMNARASGSGSADHLYIKKALTGWMAHSGLRGEASVLQDPTGAIRIGAQVTAEPSGYEPLRFILDSAVLPGPGEVPAGTVLGPGIEADQRILREQGYVHRVRCVADGVNRKVQIGTEHSNGTFDWYDFVADKVGLDPHGLSTPAVEEIRRQRTQTVPIGVHAYDLIAKKTTTAPSPSYTAVPAEAADHTALVDALRTALSDGVSVTRLQHSLDLLESVTRQGATAEENDLMRQASDELLRLRRGVGAQTPLPLPRSRSGRPKRLPALVPDRVPARRPVGGAAPQAPREQRQSRRGAIRQARSILDRLAQPRPLVEAEIPELVRELTEAVDRAGNGLTASEQRKARSWIERSAQPTGARAGSQRDRLTPDSLSSAATAVRGALKKTAREQSTTSWDTLKRQLGSALPRMTAADRVS
ncbi:hypothetical protein, partial [Streptomyces diastaticus]